LRPKFAAALTAAQRTRSIVQTAVAWHYPHLCFIRVKTKFSLTQRTVVDDGDNVVRMTHRVSFGNTTLTPGWRQTAVRGNGTLWVTGI
jgi:hypothetical protein